DERSFVELELCGVAGQVEAGNAYGLAARCAVTQLAIGGIGIRFRRLSEGKLTQRCHQQHKEQLPHGNSCRTSLGDAGALSHRDRFSQRIFEVTLETEGPAFP